MSIKNQSTFTITFQFILMILSVLLYDALSLSNTQKVELTIYFTILLPLYSIYFYFVYIALKTDKPVNSISLKYMVFFAIFYRLALFPAQEINELYHVNYLPVLSPIVQKVIYLSAELVLGFVLVMLLDHFNINRERIVIYAFNPLCVLEFYFYTNPAILLIFIFWIAVLLHYKNKSWWSVPLFALSSFGIVFPLAGALPFLVRKFWLRGLILIGLGLIIFYTTGIEKSLIQPEQRGFFYHLFLMLIPSEWFLHSENTISNWYIIIAVISVCVVLLDQMKKMWRFFSFQSITDLQASFMISAAVILLMPGMPFWTLVWLMPFMILIPKWSWMGFTVIIQFTLISLAGIIWAVYLLFFIFLFAEHRDRRSIKGWFL